MERLFLDWRKPCLPATVEYLAGRFLKAGRFDLAGVTVALPGGRAVRRLEELLVDTAEAGGATLLPPRLTTVGVLPELLYTQQKPFAEDLVQRLAWIDALKESPAEKLEPLVRTLPEPDDLEGWLALARMLSGLHRELAADALDFADVLRLGQQLGAFESEIPRWNVLVDLQQRYLTRLDNLELWDRQTARLFAIRKRECRAEGPIILAGLVDLNRAQRDILDMVSEHVTALIFADEAWANRFDEHGCLIPDEWKEVSLDLADEAIELVDSAEDQAEAVLRAIAAWGDRRSAEEIVIGVPEERIVPHVTARMADCGLTGRYGVGRKIAETGPYRLLADVARLSKDRGFSAVAALARHPDVEGTLRRQGFQDDYLSALDKIQNAALPFELPKSDDWAQREEDGNVAVCLRARDALVAMSGPLLTAETRPLAAWADPIVDVLLTVYGDRPLDVANETDRITAATCDAIREALDTWEAIPEGLMPPVAANEAVALTLAQVAEERIPAPRGEEDIEILGWLELTMDDAPALVVTGMNEGIVPSSRNSDPFLPNRLRRLLGIEDNDRRYARDAYALGVLRYSKEDLRVIAGRRSVEDDPLHPSRLFFACDDETMTRRVARFFAEEEAVRHPPLGGLRGDRINTALDVPKPWELAPELVTEDVTSMRITEFKDYLACPYRYFLRHRMKLDTLDDAAVELDAAAFGSLAHDVLERLGADENADVATSADPREVFAFLSETLDSLFHKRYDPFPRAAVRIQVEQLRQRLEAFAEKQAALAEKGWRIAHTEIAIEPGKVGLNVDGRIMGLRGRIDRIDHNEQTGKWRIIDYKTGDSGKTPKQTHRKGEEWIDLQLPLYAHLLGALGIEFTPETVELGYFVLPKKLTETRFVAAEWTDGDFDAADETARDVIRRLWGDPKDRYWPPAAKPPAFSEIFSAICQDRRFGKSWGEEVVDE